MTDTEPNRRLAFIASLRACADFLEAHPAVEAPKYVTMNVFVKDKTELAAHARIASWEKVFNGQWFWLERKFSEDLVLDITAPRETVCRRVVTGTEVRPAREAQVVETVEWVCDDAGLLAGGER